MEYAHLEYLVERLSAKLSNIEEAVNALAARQPELRDLMAMAALQGVLADPHSSNTIVGFSALAYKFADAALEARKDKP